MTNQDSSKFRTTAVLAIFAMAIGVVAYYGVKYPVPIDGASGTVAPAERYRGEQITADDVTLGDESVARLMQTDIYQQMVEDPELAQAMMDIRLTTALSDPAIQALYRDQLVTNALQTNLMHFAIGNPAVQEALASSDAFKATLQNPEAFNAVLQAAANVQQAFIGSHAQDSNVTSQDLSAVASQNLAQQAQADLMTRFNESLLANAHFDTALKADAALRDMFVSNKIAYAFTSNAMLNAIADTNVMNSLSNRMVVSALKSENLQTAMNHQQLALALQDQRIAQAIGNTNLVNAMSNENFSRAFSSSSFKERLQNDMQSNMSRMQDKMQGADSALNRY